jgi:elongation factor 3
VVKHPNLRVAYVAQHAFHHIEKHLDKTANEYIQWRFATGEDREAEDKEAKKASEEEEKKMAEKIVLDGAKYVVERLLSRRKLRNSYEYEAAFVGMPPDRNKWLPRAWLEAQGFGKMVDGIDAREAAAAGLHSKQLTAAVIAQHLADVGLDPEFTLHHRMRGLSGGQRLKVVLGACTWMNPHLVVLDEPTNFLDRDSVGALIAALKEFGGGVLAISHNEAFIEAVAKERWLVGGGTVKVEGDSWGLPMELKGAAALAAAGANLNPGEVMDAAGNVIKVKEKAKKKMTVSQRKAYMKERQARIDRGEDVSDTDEDA